VLNVKCIVWCLSFSDLWVMFGFNVINVVTNLVVTKHVLYSLLPPEKLKQPFHIGNKGSSICTTDCFIFNL